MEYKVILKNDKYALIERGTGIREYAVVYGLDEERKEWGWTVADYPFYYSKIIVTQYTQAEALARAMDIFRLRTEENYISRSRLEELATNFKDKICQDIMDTETEEEAEEFFKDYCEMENHELTFFKLEDMINEEE